MAVMTMRFNSRILGLATAVRIIVPKLPGSEIPSRKRAFPRGAASGRTGIFTAAATPCGFLSSVILSYTARVTAIRSAAVSGSSASVSGRPAIRLIVCPERIASRTILTPSTRYSPRSLRHFFCARARSAFTFSLLFAEIMIPKESLP